MSLSPSLRRSSLALPVALLVAPGLASAQSGWTFTPTGGPGTSKNILYDVDGRSADDVWAVGHHGSGIHSDTLALTMRWDGTAWEPVATPQTSDFDILQGVVALDGGGALAVGTYSPPGNGSQTLALEFDGSSWSQVSSPSVQGGSTFWHVDRGPGGSVWASGHEVGPALFTAGIYEWNGGGSWDTQLAPLVSGFRNRFHGLSILSEDEIWCVGTHGVDYGDFDILIQRYDGSGDWTTFDVPTPGWIDSLWAVEALASDDVWAAGYFWSPEAGKTQPLIMHWDGSSWSQVDLGLFPEGACELRGLTAVSAEELYASGTYALADGTPRPFLLAYDGTAWSEVDLPPTDGSHEWFRGMGTTDDGESFAVGQYFDGARTDGLAYRLSSNAASWELFGCGTNPVGSLAVVAGTPRLGTSMQVALDNPLGTQGVGAASVLVFAFAPAPGFPCGVLVPNVGMDGGPGELLVSLTAPNPVAAELGTTFGGAGSPAAVTFDVPDDLALLGVDVFAQGALLDSLGSVRIGLTEGLRLTVGD